MPDPAAFILPGSFLLAGNALACRPETVYRIDALDAETVATTVVYRPSDAGWVGKASMWRRHSVEVGLRLGDVRLVTAWHEPPDSIYEAKARHLGERNADTALRLRKELQVAQ